MNRPILKPYEVDVLQRMRELFLKGSLLKVRKNSMVEQGFTLVELMVALAILAILVSLAAPSFVAMTKNNRATAVTNDLIASFQLARTEAIKRNGTVLIQSTNGSVNWAGGHRIGIDLNADGDLDDTVSGVVELLRNVDAPHSSVTLTSDSDDRASSIALTEFSYKGNGGVTDVTTFEIDYTQCESGVSRKERYIRLGKSGSHTLTHTTTETCP